MVAPLILPEAIAVLQRTPAVLRALLAGLPACWLHARQDPSSWSPREILAHLVFGEQTDWIPRVRILLQHGEARAFESFDRSGHGALSRQPVAALLSRFAELRAGNLRALGDLDLTPTDLQRRGRHPQLGHVTLGQLLAAWTAHDLNHIDQIARTMAGRYRDATGPWNHPDYLGILHRVKLPPS